MIELKNYLRTSFNKLVLFDTSVVLDYLRGDPRAKSFFDDYVFGGLLTPAISTLTVGELFMGVRDKQEENTLNLWLTGLFDVIGSDYETLKKAGLLRRQRSIKMGDAMIAATAMGEHIPLLTNKMEQYRGLNLKIFKPY